MFVQNSKRKKEKKEKREKKGTKEKKEKARKEKQSQYIETEGVTTPSKEELPASLAATPAVYKLPVSLGFKKLLFATRDVILSCHWSFPFCLVKWLWEVVLLYFCMLCRAFCSFW